jgi:hypothetical protein
MSKQIAIVSVLKLDNRAAYIASLIASTLAGK